MLKLILCLFIFFASLSSIHAQKISGRPRFEPGKTITISIDIKNTVAQQAGAQTIDFSTQARLVHHYTVVNTTKENTRLHHGLQRIGFNIDGMGLKRAFDSDNKADIEGPWGAEIKQLLTETYDIDIDSTGVITQIITDTVASLAPDERIVFINDVLKYFADDVYPAKRRTRSYFSILPHYPIEVGSSWTDSIRTTEEQSMTTNTLSAATDSTLTIDYKTISVTNTTAKLMGTQAITKLNNTITGQIILDRASGIIRKKTGAIDYNGTTQIMGNTVPIKGSTSIVQTVTGY
jgi:hypothetical protein